MDPQKKTVRTKKGLKKYTYLGCPLTHNRTPWCFRLCIPDGEGHGQCGRVAPHSFKSRIQLGIEKHKKEKLQAHWKKLEQVYVSAPCNDYYEPGIRIEEGAAEIVIPVDEKFFHAGGAVHGATYFKALDDAAFFAVNSLVEGVFVLTVDFHVSMTRPISSGELIARGRLMGMSGDHFLAEAVLSDAEGRELGRGEGTFVKGKIKI